VKKEEEEKIDRSDNNFDKRERSERRRG